MGRTPDPITFDLVLPPLDLESGDPMIWIAGLGYAARKSMSGTPVTFEFDVPTPKTAEGPLKGYAAFWICSKQDGTCRFVRRDLEIAAPTK